MTSVALSRRLIRIDGLCEEWLATDCAVNRIRSVEARIFDPWQSLGVRIGTNGKYI